MNDMMHHRARITNSSHTPIKIVSPPSWLLLPRSSSVHEDALLGRSSQRTACEQLSSTAQTCRGVTWQSLNENCPAQLVLLPTKYMPAKVIFLVELSEGAERQQHRRPTVEGCFRLTTPLALGLKSLFIINTLQALQLSMPQTLMFCEVPGVIAVVVIIGQLLRQQRANRIPQQMAPGSRNGAVPRTAWKEAVRGLQKLMEQPDIETKAMLISRAHRAAAKELVTPSTPKPSTKRISLMATAQEAKSMVVLVLSTRRFLRQTEEQVSLSKLAIVTSETFLNTTQRKVKVVPQLSKRVVYWLTQELSAFSDMPGPSTYSPQQELQILFTSLMKLLTVQVILQREASESPQSISSKLMLAYENMFMQFLKLVMQAALLKLARSMSYPKSIEQQLPQSQKSLYMAVVSVVSVDRSLMHVIFPPQSVVLQLYLYPIGTWMQQANMLEQYPSKRDMFSRERKMGSFTQGMTSGSERESPTALLQGYYRSMTFAVKSIEERTGRLTDTPRKKKTSSDLRHARLIVQILCRKQTYIYSHHLYPSTLPIPL